MKKIMLLALALCLLPLAGVAETTLYFGEEDGTANVLADVLSELTGWPSDAAEEATAVLDRAVSDPDCVALVSQQALLEGLQGYTDCEVRTDLQLLLPLGEEELFLVTSRETADSLGLTDLPSLQAYLTDHPFELTVMRSFEAGAADYAAVQVFNALDLDSDTFGDLQDCAESLADGDYLLVANLACIAQMGDGYAVVLGPLTEERSAFYPELPSAAECGLPVCSGNVWALYIAAGEDPEPLRTLLLPAVADEAFAEVLADANLLPVAPDGFPLAELLTDYVGYMTEEGLFFYD